MAEAENTRLKMATGDYIWWWRKVEVVDFEKILGFYCKKVKSHNYLFLHHFCKLIIKVFTPRFVLFE